MIYFHITGEMHQKTASYYDILNYKKADHNMYSKHRANHCQALASIEIGSSQNSANFRKKYNIPTFLQYLC